MLGSARDLPEPVSLSELDWNSDKVLDSLGRFRAFVVERANDAIRYYQFAKKPKKRWAIWLRMGALVFAGAAGILPILSQIWTADGRAMIPPAWASVFLTLAAGAVAVDRFFGFSSAWMRFMSSELRIRRLVDDFELDWEATRARWAGKKPDVTETQQMIERGKAFLALLADVVREETDQWIMEFRETLRQLDESARTAAAMETRGGIRVTITNGDELENGWRLSLDGGPLREYHGRTAALAQVLAGVHTIQARGTIEGRKVQAEGAIAVTRGEIADLELELA